MVGRTPDAHVDAEQQPLTGAAVPRPTLVKHAVTDVRIGFVRKVYGLLSMQLLLTVAIATPIQFASPQWIHSHSWILPVCSMASLVMMCSLMCCKDVCRRYPTNYLFLFGFTTCMAGMVGFASARYTWQSVLLAAGITVLVFLAMTLYACVTKTDFTGMGPYFFAALVILCIFGFTLMIMSSMGVSIKWAHMGYDILAVMLFTMFIVYDTQLILGEWGGHKNQFSIDDYVHAALTLYLDIINLFLHILSLLGDRK